ncbi:abscisic acid 8'-hydroxylase 3-like [Aegilops tauschii subsp. strangulata]|uniref:abscisic acid 8'-hydroxylase 3-like n=1 Tax=Aegilops tauschii subsp. strangulata TaxID=200361 RepID=UPI003CC87F1E
MGWPVVGDTFAFIAAFSNLAGILRFLRERQARYDKVFKTYVLGRTTVFMTGREAAKILLSGKDGVVSLNLFYTGKQVLGPTSLLTTNGDEHQQLRRLIAQPLSMDALRKHFAFIDGLAVQILGSRASRMLVLDEASQFMLKVIANMLVSLEPEGPEQEEFRANFKAMISSSFTSLPLKLPGTTFHRGLGGRNRMYAMLDAVIACRRAGEVREYFLQTLLMKYTRGQQAGAASDPAEEEKLADAQLKDNILTLLVAGHDTTTAGQTWLVKFLGENPEVLAKLREEQMAIRAAHDGDDTQHLWWSDLSSMSYTTKVMNETLRRATILPWYSRKASQDFSIDGFQVAKGASVNLDVVSIHHDVAVFADPERFDPDRFDGSLKPYSFLGFGSGPRMCPGMSLAKLEICVFAHHLVCTYDWKALEDDASV